MDTSVHLQNFFLYFYGAILRLSNIIAGCSCVLLLLLQIVPYAFYPCALQPQ